MVEGNNAQNIFQHIVAVQDQYQSLQFFSTEAIVVFFFTFSAMTVSMYVNQHSRSYYFFILDLMEPQIRKIFGDNGEETEVKEYGFFSEKTVKIQFLRGFWADRVSISSRPLNFASSAKSVGHFRLR